MKLMHRANMLLYTIDVVVTSSYHNYVQDQSEYTRSLTRLTASSKLSCLNLFKSTWRFIC